MSLDIHNLTKIYQSGDESILALDNISLLIPDNAFVSIVGSSGSGKSTLLHLIAGLEKTTYGDISINGVNLPELSSYELGRFRNKFIGFIFQQFMLLKDFTVIENIMLPHYIATGNKKKSLETAMLLLQSLQLEHKANRYPNEISGGEAQRVAIARALINKPALVLADEPTGNLDEKNQSLVLDILLAIRKISPFTLILVTHNLEFAKKADSIISLEFGKILSIVHPPKN